MLISTSLSTNAWHQIPFLSPDVVVVQLTGPHNKVMLVNIYNNCNEHNTEAALDEFLTSEATTIQPSQGDHVIWLGDFNCHHPLWDNNDNTQLFTTQSLTRAQCLVDLLDRYGMAMALPKGILTLQLLNSKNWTRPDMCSALNTPWVSSSNMELTHPTEAPKQTMSPSSASWT
ncbi:hypothetical protein PISMIDRAFT_15565 [Pisolithus microcarpus 441]|uniref:Endonuclease/exonuclease/phosphatase domain-containing protein n=1 Tax=Pisolithus microcarpus 441 TaxID=765257 RepID=A0A0C9XWG6_9AGAM|nr:hypothetical protein PISMIDRAFT_15565 [Pisolithus microcarpus 441]